MRQIGTIANEQHALIFVDYLLTQGIDAQSEPSGEVFDLWIRDEDQVDRAKSLLAEFLPHPEADTYRVAPLEAKKIREQREQVLIQQAKNKMNVRQNWQKPGGNQKRPVTMFLIIGSIIVALLTQFGAFSPTNSGDLTSGEKLLTKLLLLDIVAVQQAKFRIQQGSAPQSFQDKLLKTSMEQYGPEDQNAITYRTWSLLNGQIWRIFTPCFIHFGLIHLVFNLWMLFQIGSMLESRVGSGKLLLFVIVAGSLSNLVQGIIPRDVSWLPPTLQGTLLFGGMSGVLYGLFGWALSRQQRGISGGLFFPPSTVFLLLAWMIAGFLFEGLRIANWCHGVGFLIGMVTGYLPFANQTPGNLSGR